MAQEIWPGFVGSYGLNEMLPLGSTGSSLTTFDAGLSSVDNRRLVEAAVAVVVVVVGVVNVVGVSTRT